MKKGLNKLVFKQAFNNLNYGGNFLLTQSFGAVGRISKSGIRRRGCTTPLSSCEATRFHSSLTDGTHVTQYEMPVMGMWWLSPDNACISGDRKISSQKGCRRWCTHVESLVRRKEKLKSHWRDCAKDWYWNLFSQLCKRKQKITCSTAQTNYKFGSLWQLHSIIRFWVFPGHGHDNCASDYIASISQEWQNTPCTMKMIHNLPFLKHSEKGLSNICHLGLRVLKQVQSPLSHALQKYL